MKLLFEARRQEGEAWSKSRRVEKFAVGQEVDVLDTEYIWCRGTVREVVSRKTRSQVLVHYEGWNKIYDEYILQSSYRLAPLGFFTSRKGE